MGYLTRCIRHAIWKLLRRLWKLLKVVWCKGYIPAQWLRAEGIFVPKEEGSKDIGLSRTVYLLNVEGKVSCQCLQNVLQSYKIHKVLPSVTMLIHQSRKVGFPEFCGCMQSASCLIREAKINKTDLTVVWLDLANAYGTVPHQLTLLWSITMWLIIFRDLLEATTETSTIASQPGTLQHPGYNHNLRAL